ncbi:MAG: Clp protease N-terminal domain-containing protein, partial [Bacteroidota bacterium]|nr:Clp protease N-terminal domain-containing protein [Bacteroidota bacterium]
MDSKFSPRIKDVLSYSREEAVRLGNDYIGTEHIFLGILRDGGGIAIEILNRLEADLNQLKLHIENEIRSERTVEQQQDSIQLLKTTEKVLKLVYLEARSFKSETINTGHLLLALLKNNDSLITKALGLYGINYQIVKSQMDDYSQVESKADYPEQNDDQDDPFL